MNLGRSAGGNGDCMGKGKICEGKMKRRDNERKWICFGLKPLN